MRVAVVVPTFDEAENIAPLLRRIRAAQPGAAVIVVDDASPDGTAARAEAAGGELGGVTVIRRAAKSGLGSAYRDGFTAALAGGADVIVQMDADLSHDPAALGALVGIVDLGADLVIGSRYVPGGRTVDWPARRKALSRWGNRYVALILGLGINDATAGYRAWSGEMLRKIDLASIAADGYGFQVEMAYAAVVRRAKIVEFPITFTERRAGVSKISGGIVREALRLVLRLRRADLRERRRRRRSGF